jgi:hypothetical protein
VNNLFGEAYVIIILIKQKYKRYLLEILVPSCSSLCVQHGTYIRIKIVSFKMRLSETYIYNSML